MIIQYQDPICGSVKIGDNLYSIYGKSALKVTNIEEYIVKTGKQVLKMRNISLEGSNKLLQYEEDEILKGFILIRKVDIDI